MSLAPQRPPTLLLIDVQQGFHAPSWGPRNNPQAEARMAQLLAHWRAQRPKPWPVIHIQHASTHPASPVHPSQPGFAIQAVVAPLPHEPVLQKHVNSAFIGTTLETDLRAQDCNHLVIVGLTTDHCVSTTTRMAGNLGFQVTLVSDATATFDRTAMDGATLSADTIHRVHLASLHGEFCQVRLTAEVLAKG